MMLLAVMAQTYNRAFIVLDYYTNTASFAMNCENKARPELHCNGKCQMIKKLKQEENKDTQNADSKGAGKYEIISSKSYFSSLPQPVINREHTNFIIADNKATIGRPRAIFHPPSC